MWPFRRKPKRMLPPPADRWAAADMAECLDDGWRPPLPGRAPVRGDRAMVMRVFVGDCDDGVSVGVALELLGYPEAWDARAFRRIVLPATAADRTVVKAVPTRRPEPVEG